MVLADGTLVIFEYDAWYDSSCSLSQDGSTGICTYINVDLNGFKKPNAYGRDLFSFIINKKGLYPMGCDSEGCISTTKGQGCACKVLREGAINY